MTIQDQVKKFIEEVKTGNIADAMDTVADLLKRGAGFYRLVFGGAVAAVTMTEEDLTAEETELRQLYATATYPVATASGSTAGNPAMWALLIEVVLKIIAERNKKK